MRPDPTVSFDQPADAFAPTNADTSPPRAVPAPSDIPGYEVLEELGRGGMGIVWKARHVRLNRVVALKMILGQPYGVQLDRFRAEAELLARLQHPHIVQVFDVGEHQGCPYLSLEYCAGGSLDRRLSQHTFPPKEAARLIASLAGAMQAAHEAGVVHRDLKPANILLAVSRDAESSERSAGDGFALRSEDSTSRLTEVAKITDFGLAKKLDDVSQTQSGAVLGTPSYMAPEQASGLLHEVGPPADIYALGAILYECLTGRPPFRAATMVDTLDLVRHIDPLPPRRLLPSLPRDLETICLKCLNKHPKQRYPSAGALAEDLQRFLDGEPIQARPIGRVTRALKWARRKPAIAALSVALMLSTLVGVVAFAWAFREMEQERDFARKQQEIAEGERVEANSAKERALRKGEETEHILALSNIQLAQAIWLQPNALSARVKLEEVPEHKRSWEWRFLRRALDGSIYTIHQQQSPIQSVAFHPGGDWFASSNDDGQVVISDVRTGERLRAFPARPTRGNTLRDIAFSPDGKELAVAHSPLDGNGVVRVWEMATGRVQRILEAPGDHAHCIAYSPDGKFVAAGQADRSVRVKQPVDIWIWERSTGRLLHALKGHTRIVSRLAFSPDSRRLASVGGDTVVRVWDLRTGKLTLSCKGENFEMKSIAFSPDGRLLASGATDGSVSLWSPTDGRFIGPLIGCQKDVKDLAFSPDGQLLAAGGSDAVIVLWNTSRFDLVRTLIGHRAAIERVSFSPEGHLIASAGWDHALKVWDVRPARAGLQLARTPLFIESFACAPDSRLLATATRQGIHLWDGFTGQQLRTIPVAGTRLIGLTFSHDGRRIAGTDLTTGLHVWNVETGALLHQLKPPEGRFSCSLFAGREGDKLITAWWNPPETKADIRVFDSESGKLLRTLPVSEAVVGDLAVSPEGRWVAIPTGNEEVRLWDTETGEKKPSLKCPAGVITTLGFSPDGKVLAAGCQGGSVVCWDIASGERTLQFAAHSGGTFVLHFSPDNRRLATRGLDLNINVWDIQTGQRLISFRLGVEGIHGLCFSNDGLRLYALDRHRVIAWDAEAPTERTTLRGHLATVNSAGYSPDGKLVVTASDDGTARLWDADTGECRRVLTCGKEPNGVAFHKHGNSVRVSVSGTDYVEWNLETGEEMTVSKHGDYFSRLYNSPIRNCCILIDGPHVHLIPTGQLDEREEGRRRLMTARDLAWHMIEATRYERSGPAFPAVYHMERSLTVEPWNAALWLRHARSAARAGMTAKAAMSYLQSVLLDPRMGK